MISLRLLIVALLALPLPGRADPADQCLHAARQAGEESGVPYDVLAAITLTETGRTRQARTQPWPWTVNMEGEGEWFDAPSEALDFVHRRRAAGATSFDIGCFQINHRWHGEHFTSIESMFDPLTNARYAARFLRELHREFGDWSLAAGAFHSRNEAFAGRYRARFAQFRRGIEPAPAAVPERVDVALASPARRSNYPLFAAGGTAGLGSLMPRRDGGQPLIRGLLQ